MTDRELEKTGLEIVTLLLSGKCFNLPPELAIEKDFKGAVIECYGSIFRSPRRKDSEQNILSRGS